MFTPRRLSVRVYNWWSLTFRPSEVDPSAPEYSPLFLGSRYLMVSQRKWSFSYFADIKCVTKTQYVMERQTIVFLWLLGLELLSSEFVVINLINDWSEQMAVWYICTRRRRNSQLFLYPHESKAYRVLIRL